MAKLARAVKHKKKPSYTSKKIKLNQIKKLNDKYSKNTQNLQNYQKIRDLKHRHIQHRKKTLKKNKLVLTAAIAILMLIGASFLFFPKVLTGQVVEQETGEFKDVLNYNFDQTIEFTWTPIVHGEIDSIKITGEHPETGSIKVFIEDQLIYEYESVQTSFLTGQVIGEGPSESKILNFFKKIFGAITGQVTEEEAPIEKGQTSEEEPEEESEPEPETATETEIEEPVEEIQEEEAPIEEEIPTPEENLEEETNETPNSKESNGDSEGRVGTTKDQEQKNATETKEKSNKKSEILINFTKTCQETCQTQLNKTNYTIRIEISDSELNLKEIIYNIPPEVQVEENITTVTENETTEETIQEPARIGEPVKWTKKIKSETTETLEIEIPEEAEEITIQDEENKQIEFSLIEGEVVTQRGILGALTGQSIEEPQKERKVRIKPEKQKEYYIIYETPAPYTIEEKTRKGKKVKVIGPETIHYNNITTFTSLNDSLKIKDSSNIRITWIEQNQIIPINIIQDQNNNGYYDYIEWITPNLSNQTFEIIVIINAEHLSSQKIFISNIYNETKTLDNVWSETINNNEYVRIQFKKTLDNTKDITIYPRVLSGNPKIEIYEVDKAELLGTISNIESYKYTQFLLTSLTDPQDTFELKISGGSIQFDHIIDPVETGLILNGDFFSDSNNWGHTLVIGRDVESLWENTGRTGGSIYTHTTTRKEISEDHWTQSFTLNSTHIDYFQDAQLDFCYQVTNWLEVVSLSLEISITDPSATESTIWSNSPTGNVVWTCPIQNISSYITTSGAYTITLKHLAELQNTKTPSVKSYWDDISLDLTYQPPVANTAPTITNIYQVTDVSSGLNEGPISTPVTIKFTAEDNNGYTDLNDASAQIQLTKTGETTRQTSCTIVGGESSGNIANYTCTVYMWWWDAPGSWTINATIEDSEPLSTNNDTETMTVGSTTGFVAYPLNLTWATLSPGATNQESNEIIIINNTGNLNQSLEINASDLIGKTDSLKSIPAANFKLGPSAGCGGTALTKDIYTSITGITVQTGNYTINDGTGQEELYTCISTVPNDLTSQDYTSEGGAWILRIFAVGLTATRKRKKKKEKLVESLNVLIEKIKEEELLDEEELISIVKGKVKQKEEEIEIPIEIFTKELGALESITKYLKENKKLAYVEIAKLLSRDQRTIWTAYHKSKEKLSTPIRIRKVKKSIPINNYLSNNLTILETTVQYLRNENMRYSEIGKILNRNERNIWTINNRLQKK